MAIIHADPRTAFWTSPDGSHKGAFRPNGKTQFIAVGDDYEPNNKQRFPGGSGLAGRVFVGFNVGPTPTYSIGFLISIVKKVRAKQSRSPNSTFVAQTGVYQSSKTGETVTEDGAQVIIVDQDNLTPKAFEDEMEFLAETIAREMSQESVMLEIQHRGMSKDMFEITPSVRRKPKKPSAPKRR